MMKGFRGKKTATYIYETIRLFNNKYVRKQLTDTLTPTVVAALWLLDYQFGCLR
jgi:hypothetical protein